MPRDLSFVCNTYYTLYEKTCKLVQYIENSSLQQTIDIEQAAQQAKPIKCFPHLSSLFSYLALAKVNMTGIFFSYDALNGSLH